MANREGVTISDAEGVTLRTRYEGGESIARLAQELHTRPDRVKAAIRRAGGTIRRAGERQVQSWENRTTARRKLEDADREDVTRRFMRGESLRSIATDYGASHPTVLAALRRWGVVDG